MAYIFFARLSISMETLFTNAMSQNAFSIGTAISTAVIFTVVACVRRHALANVRHPVLLSVNK